jgi:hypothetical protein
VSLEFLVSGKGTSTAIILLLIVSGLVPAIQGGTTHVLSDGNTIADVEFLSGGHNTSASFSLPNASVVTNAKFDVIGKKYKDERTSDITNRTEFLAGTPVNVSAGPDRIMLDGNAYFAAENLYPAFLGYREPYGTALGDLNGDGRTDIAVSYMLDGRAGFFPGLGDGNFTAFREAPNQLNNPMGIAVGDVNGDTWADLVVAEFGAGSVAVFYQDAVTHRLGSRTVCACDAWPVDVAIGDFNNDLLNDIAVVAGNNSACYVDVLNQNSGTHALNASVQYTLTAGPAAVVSIAAGNVSGDALTDIVATVRGNSVYVLAQQAGAFAAPAAFALDTGFQGRGVAIGDVNGTWDGNEIVVGVTDATRHGFAVYNTTGASPAKGLDLLWYAGFPNAGPIGVGVGDVDGNGKSDIVVALPGPSGAVSVIPQGAGGDLQAAVPYKAAGEMRELAIGDLNADSQNDVVVAARPDLVTALFQNPQGTLGGRMELRFETTAVAVGDLNTDGRVDIAFAARYSSRIGIIYQGLSGFNPVTMIGPCEDTIALGIGDVTGDNVPDLVALCRGNDTLAVYAQQIGVLQAPLFLPTGKGPSAMAMGDVTGDGKFDVVVTHRGDQNLTVFCQTGGMLLQDRYNLGDGQTAVALGDFTGDGRTDVALSRWTVTASSVIIMAQNANGKLASDAAYPVGKGPVALASGDLDTDGRTDLASMNLEDRTFTPLFQNASGPGLIRKPDVQLYARPVGAAACGLTTDGRNQLLVWLEGGNISTFRQDNSGGFQSPQNISVDRSAPVCAVTDLDKDGRPDIAAVTPSGRFYPLIQTGFQRGIGRSYGADTNPQFMSSGDLNNDGLFDLVTETGDRLSIYYQQPGGVFGPRMTITHPGTAGWPGDIDIGDLNGDGWNDIAVAGLSSVGVYIFNGTPMGPMAPYYFPITNLWARNGLCIADVSSDGREDLVVLGWNGISVLLQTPSGTLATPWTYPTGGSWPNGLAVADMNGDGRKDVVTANTGSNNIGILLQNMGGNLNSAIIYATSGNSQGTDSLAVGDVNGDGRNDVLIVCKGSKMLDVLTQKNDGSLNDKVSYPVYENDNTGPTAAVADLDADGQNEVVVSNSNSGNLTIFDQDSSGVLFEKDTYKTGTNPHGVVARDMNGDGCADIAVSNGGSNNLTVFMERTGRGSYFAPVIIAPAAGGFENVTVGWNETAVKPGTSMGVQLSADGVNWTAAGKDVKYTFTTQAAMVHVRVDFTSTSNFNPGITSVHASLGYSAYPVDPAVDVGDDGSVDWNHAGKYTGKETIIGQTLVGVLNTYLDAHRSDPGPNITVPLNLTSASEGMLTITNISIDYDMPPYLAQDLPANLTVKEDSVDTELLDLGTYFKTERSDLMLTYDILSATNDSIVKVTVEENTWLAVDSDTAPESDNWTGQVAVSLKVTDVGNLSFLAPLIIITVEPVNDAPVILSSPNATATVGIPWSYQVTARDAESPSLRYVLDKGLAGMELNSTTGLLTWFPRKEHMDVMDKTVSVRVYDGQLYSAIQDFKMTINLNLAPVITSLPPMTVYLGDDYLYKVNATDPENSTLAFSLIQGPSNMTINATSGIITWRPVAAQKGLNSVQIMVTDGINPVIQNFQIDVQDRPVPNRAPEIMNTPPLNATVNQTYRHVVLARDNDGDVLSYSVEPKPVGMTIDNATGIILWTPGAWQVGNHPVVLRVSDGKVSVTQQFTINVKSDVVTPPVNHTKPVQKQDNTLIFAISGVLAGILVAMILFIATRSRRADMLEQEARRKARPKSQPKRATPARLPAPSDEDYVPSDEEMDEDFAKYLPPPVPPPEPAAPAETERGPSDDDDDIDDLDDDDEPVEELEMDETPAPKPMTSPGPSTKGPKTANAPDAGEREEELDQLFGKLGVEKGGKGASASPGGKGGGAKGRPPEPKRNMDETIEDMLGLGGKGK